MVTIFPVACISSYTDSLGEALKQSVLRLSSTRPSVYVCICVYMCVYICMCIYIYIYVYTHTCMCECTCQGNWQGGGNDWNWEGNNWNEEASNIINN